MAQERGGIFPNIRPMFPGPIMPKKHGRLARYSFIGHDGKCHYHKEARLFLSEQKYKSLTGK